MTIKALHTGTCNLNIISLQKSQNDYHTTQESSEKILIVIFSISYQRVKGVEHWEHWTRYLSLHLGKNPSTILTSRCMCAPVLWNFFWIGTITSTQTDDKLIYTHDWTTAFDVGLVILMNLSTEQLSSNPSPDLVLNVRSLMGLVCKDTYWLVMKFKQFTWKEREKYLSNDMEISNKFWLLI